MTGCFKYDIAVEVEVAFEVAVKNQFGLFYDFIEVQVQVKNQFRLQLATHLKPHHLNMMMSI